MKAMKKTCAIYTRKSTDERLDMEFNTLDAQRESCEADIISQKSEGWTASKEYYDDGGFSGGSLERPALMRLIDDIKAGKIQTVVVYKIDRLNILMELILATLPSTRIVHRDTSATVL